MSCLRRQYVPDTKSVPKGNAFFCRNACVYSGGNNPIIHRDVKWQLQMLFSFLGSILIFFTYNAWHMQSVTKIDFLFTFFLMWFLYFRLIHHAHSQLILNFSSLNCEKLPSVFSFSGSWFLLWWLTQCIILDNYIYLYQTFYNTTLLDFRVFCLIFILNAKVLLFYHPMTVLKVLRVYCCYSR